jgi:transcriptional regulator with XRE-family HTH domain
LASVAISRCVVAKHAPRYQLTDAAIAAVKAERAAGGTQRTISRFIGLRENRLSRWLHRDPLDRPSPEDQRLRRLAAWLELPVEACVEEVP